jgi:hypothetical protein
VLDLLPSLQALIVSDLSFFDHQALQTIHQGNGAPNPAQNVNKYGLRLLNAANCENTTAASLAAALSHFPDLMYLDLSSTQGSRSQQVLQQIGCLSHLRVLKIKNCGLKDYDIDVLSLPVKLRSLDVSENYLTEHGISALMYRLPAANLPRRTSSLNFRKPSQRVALQSLVLSRLTNSTNGHFLVEESLPPTFADLYLAGNCLTIDDLNRILCFPSIEYLDCGSLRCNQSPELASPGTPDPNRRQLKTLGFDKLSPALFIEAFRNIRSLRIHHSIITGYPFSGNDLPPTEQCFELDSEDLRYELDSSEVVAPEAVYELGDTSIEIVLTQETEAVSEQTKNNAEKGEIHASFESPDDVGINLTPCISPQNHTSNCTDIGESPKFCRNPLPPRISISSPNHVQTVLHSLPVHSGASSIPVTNPQTPESPVAPHGPETYRYTYSAKQDRRWQDAARNTESPNLKELIEEIKLRRHRTSARERHPGRFQPSMLPNLKVLTLTDVPSSTRRRTVVEALSMFIQECGEEEEIAQLEERDRFANGHGDGNSNGSSNVSIEPTKIYKLQRLVLETSSSPDPILLRRSPIPSRNSKRNSFTKSSTEDPDSESFMEASSADFTFFGEDDGGLLVTQGRIDAPLMSDDGMIVDTDNIGHTGHPVVNRNGRSSSDCSAGGAGTYGNGNESNSFLNSPSPTHMEMGFNVDVVSELAGFRRERKKAREVGMRFGKAKVDLALDGFWVGEVKVVKEIMG